MELILFAMISLIVIVALLASRLNDNSFPFPFDSKPTVFTPAEKNFQTLVEEALGEQYRVINRVKLSDLVNIRKGVSNKASQIASNNAESKYLDFVICERNSMKLLGAIDLVDTQGKGYKVKKDWFVSGALEAAAIPHLRIKVKANYSIKDIRSCIKTRLLGDHKPEPKIKGRVIPAPLIKARPVTKETKTGALTHTAASAQISRQITTKIPNSNQAALPH